MKYIGIDYGMGRIGIAVSDGNLARPVGYIVNKGDRKNIAAMTEIFRKHDFSTISGVVCLGVPLYKDGKESAMSGEVRRFGELLRTALGCTVVYQNEYLTSVEAESYIRTVLGITKPEKIKELVDGTAAFMILQTYINNTIKGE